MPLGSGVREALLVGSEEMSEINVVPARTPLNTIEASETYDHMIRLWRSHCRGR
jgi:hypothetical protein